LPIKRHRFCLCKVFILVLPKPFPANGATSGIRPPTVKTVTSRAGNATPLVHEFPGEGHAAKQFDEPEPVGYLGNVNRTLNPNLLLDNALLLRRAAVGF